MPEIKDTVDDAEEAFKQYPFDADEAWHKFRRAAEVTAPSAEAEERLRRAFFRKHINSLLPLKPRETTPTAMTGQSAQQGQVAFSESFWKKGRLLLLRIRAWCAAPESWASIESTLDLLTLTTAMLTLWLGASSVVTWTWASLGFSLVVAFYRNWTRQPRAWPGRLRLERALASDDCIPRVLFMMVGMQLRHPIALRLAMIPLSIAYLYRLVAALERSETWTLRILSLAPATRQHVITKLRRREADARMLAAYAEVGLFALLLGSLFTPSRSVLAVFVFYRYVQLRYLGCRYTQIVWEQVEAQLDMWSMWLPPALRDIYLRGKQLVKSMAGAARIRPQANMASHR
ncbi:hypothetical protein F1559_003446 [Cyanidiococcus yangmingshanensis]|uniref:Transmembrane protein 33 n=1 Tax=Cyanidiococcus yangmingshanensis TaxID=2690220 RepID=A0A7J7IGI4_9RHOD|nr:hypothetical protein F1559_003446 [Cyanidiococcus yangmingshanensis]